MEEVRSLWEDFAKNPELAFHRKVLDKPVFRGKSCGKDTKAAIEKDYVKGAM